MPLDLLLAFLTYAFVTSITPGPNNTMVLASGVNHGFSRTIPHVLGISSGFAVMVLAVGFGIGRLFITAPWLYEALRWIGAAYLLWLAWKIATASAMDEKTTASKPMSFWQAAAFQWVNPKAWVMAIGAIATYTPANGGLGMILLVAVLFAVVNAPTVALWAAFGTTLRRWLTDARYVRIFNITMAALLVLSLQPLLWGGMH
ncbi:LysE family translocator [Bosea vestrisii]|uniref:LysE family translocator n=1 Tax=Bosea vestrisii TaxID=151416 RepID=UPI0024DF7F33|nr:LysE family translocator [Bosea vestrisii]WID96944.1 LysE family translocator [Bosea vestrisii]